MLLGVDAVECEGSDADDETTVEGAAEDADKVLLLAPLDGVATAAALAAVTAATIMAAFCAGV